ncbi:hypothetical protein WA158_000164 [Blastocystis sp. Blastoise]
MDTDELMSISQEIKILQSEILHSKDLFNDFQKENKKLIKLTQSQVCIYDQTIKNLNQLPNNNKDISLYLERIEQCIGILGNITMSPFTMGILLNTTQLYNMIDSICNSKYINSNIQLRILWFMCNITCSKEGIEKVLEYTLWNTLARTIAKNIL